MAFERLLEQGVDMLWKDLAGYNARPAWDLIIAASTLVCGSKDKSDAADGESVCVGRHVAGDEHRVQLPP